jgi:hypothetical protein
MNLPFLKAKDLRAAQREADEKRAAKQRFKNKVAANAGALKISKVNGLPIYFSERIAFELRKGGVKIICPSVLKQALEGRGATETTAFVGHEEIAANVWQSVIEPLLSGAFFVLRLQDPYAPRHAHYQRLASQGVTIEVSGDTDAAMDATVTHKGARHFEIILK